MTAPSIAPADAELLRLETAMTAIASNLVDLDDNPARKDLDKTKLTGRTAAAWADATDALTQLWDGYRMLTDVIAEARSLRDKRKLSDADRAAFVHRVQGRSITLSTTTVPLAQRGLLGAGQVHTTCSPAELLSAMEAAFQTAVTVATQAGEVWQKLLPAAADATAAVDNVRVLIRLHGGPQATIDEADRRLGAFTRTLATDPLSVDERELFTVRDLVARADAERTSAAELKEALTQRLADAHALLDQFAEAQRAADVALDAAADRFREQDLRVVRGPDLRPDLAAVDALAAAGQWALISPRLADWTRRARERLAALRDAAAHNDGLLVARNELRGRLDAYRAKALRRGLGEDAELTPLAEAARTALYTAPCDLDAARVAVNAYQDALTATIARNGR
ncbi:hypothetical protein [Actinoplanes subtropicus]|uniref:hypothetical protein n=1 Tax=Actinoplanes subtropicus TaxID=543632 RepID=UPI0004C3507C|nr:hypothetical protein [Actinoplanes subtropicus]